MATRTWTATANRKAALRHQINLRERDGDDGALLAHYASATVIDLLVAPRHGERHEGPFIGEHDLLYQSERSPNARM